jgi:hypothetical protein
MDMETLSFSSIGDALAEEFPTEGLAGKTMGVVSTLIKIAVIVVIAAIVIRKIPLCALVYGVVH